MKHISSLKFLIASLAAALLCLGAGTASAQLYIRDVFVYTDDGAPDCTAETDRLTFVVDVRNNSNPSPLYQPEVELVGTGTPTFAFNLQGVPRTAVFDGVGSINDGEENLLFFVYNPTPTDYGTGLTMPNGGTSNQRKSIIFSAATLTIRDKNMTAAVLGENGQIPVLMTAWIPPMTAALFALSLLLHLEDG